MSESNWVKISLDSNYFVAGERLTGELLVTVGENPLRCIIKSSGNERVRVEKPNGNIVNHCCNIFSLEEQLAICLQNAQIVYPFSIKLPYFAPATFQVDDMDIYNNHVKAEISYLIEANLSSDDKEIAYDSQTFTMYSKDSRIMIERQIEFPTDLTACWCIPRGVSTIRVEATDLHHFFCKESKKYKITIDCAANESLESVRGQVFYNLIVTIPGEKQITIRKILSRYVPSLDILKHNSSSPHRIVYDFETDLSLNNIGESPSSNNSALFSSEYKIQLFGVYNIGCRSKRAECELSVYVNPIPNKFEKPNIPGDWNPKESLLRSLILNVNSSILQKESEIMV